MGQPVDMGKWKGLFEWSMKYQDGTQPAGEAKELTPEKKKWLEEALTDFMKDFADRMKEINNALSSDDTPDALRHSAEGNGSKLKGLNLAEKEALCDELMDIVESVDYAKDLHKIGGLPTLLSLMSSSHPSLRWRAAEITATCMANNPPVQRWFMDGGALPPLMKLLFDHHVVVQTKAVLAVSALVRHYGPGLEAFRLAGGLQKLLALLGCSGTDAGVEAAVQQPAPDEQQQGSTAEDDEDQMLQQSTQQRRLKRKVLALLHYMLLKHPADCLASAEFGIAAQLRLCLQEAADSDMRQAALSVIADLLRSPQAWAWVKEHEGQSLVQQLEQLQQQHNQLNAEDRDAEREEGQLLGQCLAALHAEQPPASCALQDHVELDPYQDGGQRAEKTINVREPYQQQDGIDVAAGGMALMAVPKPELR